MAEPSGIVSSQRIIFDQGISRIQNAILSQGACALEALIARIDRLRSLIASSPIADLFIDPEIPGVLSEIGFHQGVASTVLFNDKAKGDREPGPDYRLRKDRIDYVRQRCIGISTAILSDKKVRNSLTHVDEHLARRMRKPNTIWIIDTAFARRDQFAPPPGTRLAFCRTYISSEDVLLHLENEISLPSLQKEAVSVLARVFGIKPYTDISRKLDNDSS